MARGEINADPVQEEFFTPREDRVDGLVREADQNTLDAGLPGTQVRVRYTISERPLASRIARKYLAGLERHVGACLPDAPLDQPMSYLLVEDFGTRGLSGDPRQDSDDESARGPRNDFYYFWRNVGRSRKSETDRGRWGLGKTVFPATSRINSFFGLTRRHDDGRVLLMGQSVLKVHNIARTRFCPYVYFGKAEPDGFVVPIDEEAAITEFTTDFGLQRTVEPGLSIVIPYVRDDELEPDALIRSTIMNYFFPILGGHLVVEVRKGARRVVIDRESLKSIAAGLDWSRSETDPRQLAQLLDLAAWAIGLPDAGYFQLRDQGAAAPIWHEDLLDRETLATLRDRYDRGERLGFRVPVKVERMGTPAKTANFRVFVMKDLDLKRGEDHYIRQGITITEIRMLREGGVRGLVVVDDRDLSSLLGDAENPAHTDWQERSTKLKERFKHGPSCVRFVKRSLREIVGFLSRPPEGIHEDLLRDLFFVDRPEGVPAGNGGNDGTGVKRPTVGPTLPPPPPPPPVPAPFRLDQMPGGFRIRGNPEAEGVRLVEVEAAYEVRRGNAFRRYHENDFDLSRDIEIVTQGATVERANGKHLAIRVNDPGFEVTVSGFDSNRDLKVRARRRDGDDA
jgi:hypothetical protein